MFELSFVTIFLNIKLFEVLKIFLTFFLFFFIWTSFLFLITQKKITKLRSIINYFNIINEFLFEIKKHIIIILSKPDLDDELINIDIL